MQLYDQLDAMKEQLSPDAQALLKTMIDEHKTAADADLALSQKMGELSADLQALKAADGSESVDQLMTRVAAVESKQAEPQTVADDSARTLISVLTSRIEALEAKQ